MVDWSTRIYPVRGAGELDIRGVGGKVRILPGTEGHIVLHGTIRTTARDKESARIGSQASNIVASPEGDKVVVELDAHDPPHGGTVIELFAEVPPRLPVRIHTRGSNIEALSLAGPLDVQSQTAAVSIGFAGPANVHAETRRGRIDQDLGLTVGKRGKSTVADGRVGGGGPQVNVQIDQGSISLHNGRSPAGAPVPATIPPIQGAGPRPAGLPLLPQKPAAPRMGPGQPPGPGLRPGAGAQPSGSAQAGQPWGAGAARAPAGGKTWPPAPTPATPPR
jgi:hypothetical protein